MWMKTMGGGAVPLHAYTPKAFLDLIAKWIIADDQVCILFYFISLLTYARHSL